jgi:hypothetical protein
VENVVAAAANAQNRQTATSAGRIICPRQPPVRGLAMQKFIFNLEPATFLPVTHHRQSQKST